MKSILPIFNSSAHCPITDDQYREKVASNATAIFNMLFTSLPESFYQLSTMNILVIGAGFFPSYMPLVTILNKLAPGLSRLHFSLIEPLKSETDRFATYFSSLNQLELKVSYTAHNMDIQEYLKTSQHTDVDIVYYEQPDLSPIGILLAANEDPNEILNYSLRESVPYLKNIIRPQSIIIASCLYSRDLMQLNSLINVSLNIPTRLAYLPGYFMDGSPYHSGLISIVDPQKLPREKPEVIAKVIKITDTYYSLFLVVSFTLFILTPPLGKIPSLLLTLLLVFYHSYGMNSVIIKTLIISIQISILIGFFI